MEATLNEPGVSFKRCWDSSSDHVTSQVVGSPGKTGKCAAPLFEPLHQHDDKGLDLSLF